jgi:hypothetical protein
MTTEKLVVATTCPVVLMAVIVYNVGLLKAVGVPLITPVDVLNVRPVGKFTGTMV